MVQSPNPGTSTNGVHSTNHGTSTNGMRFPNPGTSTNGVRFPNPGTSTNGMRFLNPGTSMNQFMLLCKCTFHFVVRPEWLRGLKSAGEPQCLALHRHTPAHLYLERDNTLLSYCRNNTGRVYDLAPTATSFVMNLYLNIPMSTGYFVWSSAYVAAFNASWSHCNGWHRPYWALACTCISICFRSVQRQSCAFFAFLLTLPPVRPPVVPPTRHDASVLYGGRTMAE